MQQLRVAAVILASVAPMAAGIDRAQAASVSLVYSFKAGRDGNGPYGALLDIGGTLYGTTSLGGAGDHGTVFKVTPAGVEHVLYAFKGFSDGFMPYAGLINVGGTLFGTTMDGGAVCNDGDGCGTVFTVTRGGAKATLYSFNGDPSDGDSPEAGLLNVGGTLYGTTASGGPNGAGLVFQVTQAGAETVLHLFGGDGDGVVPIAALINVGGTLYGTTVGGGAGTACNGGCGTVFTVNPATGVEKVLYSFTGGPDGANPHDSLLKVGGKLYGTTYGGGTNGFGTVFALDPSSGTEKVLYSFTCGLDGCFPQAGLVDVNGTLYGTSVGSGDGNVFSITRTGVETAVYQFSGLDGAYPNGLIDVGGILYGTTQSGGAHDYGAVFALTP